MASQARKGGTPGLALVLVALIFMGFGAWLHLRHQVDLPSLVLLGGAWGVASGQFCRWIFGLPEPHNGPEESKESQ